MSTFLVFEHPKACFDLSPYIMRWKDQMWIIDLTPVVSYWTMLARKNQQSLVDLLTELKMFERAAMARHPWQALLLFYEMRQRDLKGLWSFDSTDAVNDHSQYAVSRTVVRMGGEHLWQDIDWSIWLKVVQDFTSHLPRVKSGALLRKAQDFVRVVRKMNLHGPQALHAVLDTSDNVKHTLGIQALTRRFGTLVGKLWKWTLATSANNAELNVFGPDDFPWRNEQVPTERVVARFFDVLSPYTWDQCEPLLREDFDQLFRSSLLRQALADDELVLSLEWVLSLATGSRLSIPIRFRHPYAPRREQSHYKTALLQAYYSYENHLRCKDRRSIDTFNIESWEVRISATFKQTLYNLQLFTENTTAALLDLENTLPIPLESYQLIENWIPEYGFQQTSSENMQVAQAQALSAQSRARPLFIERQPKLFDVGHRSKGWIFCERVWGAWWNDEGELRDYYKVVDDQGLGYWVYRTSKNEFFLHGIFA